MERARVHLYINTTPSPSSTCTYTLMQVSKGKRGTHWIEKFAAGNGPELASHVTAWAERSRTTELKLKALLPGYVLPWLRGKTAVATRMGNSGKVLFMQLLIHHVNKVVRIQFEDGAGELGEQCTVGVRGGFFGISCLRILQHDVFNSAEGGDIHTISWARTNMPKGKAQTVSKLWHSYGFSELRNADGTLEYTFSGDLRLRAQELGENEHKKHKGGAGAVATPSVPESSVQIVLCPPVVSQPAPGSIAFIVEPDLIGRANALEHRAAALEQIALKADRHADALEQQASRVEQMLDALEAGKGA